MTAPVSPSFLQPTPTRAPGVKRFNNVPYYVVGVGAVLAISAIGYTMVSRAQRQQVEVAATEAAKKPKGSGMPGFLQWPKDHGDIEANVTKSVSHGEIPAEKTAFSPNPATQTYIAPQSPYVAPQSTAQNAPQDLAEQARARAWAAYYQQTEAVQAARFNASLAARQGQADPQAGGSGVQQATPAATGQPVEPAGQSGKPYSTGGTDPAGQTGKQAFLRTPGDTLGLDEDLPGSVHGPKPSTVMEGTPIPGRLVEAATSDSPGQLVAEVTTNVYDDMTGDILLIPQWTRIITTYDTAVSTGQDRIGVISQRLIFPDTSSRQLGSMEIADQSGMAGLKDIVRTHFWEKFWATAAISLAGAGAQLAQPQQSAFSGYSPSSVATGQLTQGFSQLGQTIAQKSLSIPNTIELRAGLPLVIKPNHDITLPAYVDHRALAGR